MRICAGASPRTPLGELTVLLQAPSWCREGLLPSPQELYPNSWPFGPRATACGLCMFRPKSPPFLVAKLRPWLSLWPPCVADADIIFLSCGFSIFLLFFLAYSQPSQIGCLPYFYTWCSLSANLACRSEICHMRKMQDANNRQKFAICTPSHNFVGLYLRN